VLAFLYGRRRGYVLLPRRGEPRRSQPPGGERGPDDWVLYDEHGFAELDLPGSWHAFRPKKTETAPQAKQAGRARYVALVSECKGDFADDVTLDAHSEMTRRSLGETVRMINMRGPTYRFVAGRAAVQYEFDALSNSVRLIYLHTTVDGDRAFHQIVCRSTRSQYDRAAFEQLLDGFRESSGPPRPPAPEDQMPVFVSSTGSAYDVH
jgi:hypothetical protein